MSETNKTPILTVANDDYINALETKAAQATENYEKYLRTMADLDNYRKRAAREKEDTIKFANESLIEQLLPVMDSFELGIDSASQTKDAAAIAQGMRMAVNQLLGVLKQNGITPIEAVGQIFDPHLHEAVSNQETDQMPEGTVLQQLRKGYKLKDRLLRPASVIVAKSSKDH